MANIEKYINKITVPSGSDTITANLVDNVSGYTKNTGTVTSVGISGTSPISASGTVTSTGTLSVSHEASGVTAQSIQALYPFKVNSTGHITEVGTAVTVKEPAYILAYNTTVDATAVQNAYNDNIPIYVSYSETESGITTYYLCPLYNYTVFQNNIYLWFGTSYLWYNSGASQTTVNSLAITYTTANGWSVDNENAVFPTATSDLTNDSGFITLSDVPSAGTTATAVSTTASGGSATTWSKSDHVHSISSSTITTALGYTPYNNSNPSGYISKNLYSIQIPSNYGTSGEVLGLSTGFNDHPTYHYADLTDFTVETSVTENLSTGDTVEFFINGVSYGIGTFSGNSSFDINNMVGTLTSVTCDIAESEIIFNYSGTSPFPNSFPSVDTGDDYYDMLISIKKIVSNWIETTTGVWTQTVSVPGILLTDNPFVQANISTIAEQESWNLIVKGEAVTDGIIFTALSSAPTVNLSAIVMVFR